MVYLYCRISTKKQNINRQIRNLLRAYPEGKIIEEVYTGATIDRKEFNKLLKMVRAGDTIVFDSVSRMSRNADEGFKLYEELFNRGVNLEFLKEPYINTTTYKDTLKNNISLTGTFVDCILKGINEFLMEFAKEQIRIAFEQAEKEVQDLRLSTSEGMRASNAPQKISEATKGMKKTTKKSIKAKEIIKAMSRDFNGTKTDVELINLIHVTRNTYYKYKKEIKQELDGLIVQPLKIID